MSNNNEKLSGEDTEELLCVTETVMYYAGIDADPNEASKALSFRKNVAIILKAVRIKLNYHDFEAGVFFSFLCNATEEEVKQKLEELL